MDIRPIKNTKNYENALLRMEQIFDAPVDSPEGDAAEALSLLIENYENEHFLIEVPDPVEAIKIRMEELNLKQKDLIGVIGGKSRVSEILNKKKRLTVEMIRNLNVKLNLSTSILVQSYQLSE